MEREWQSEKKFLCCPGNNLDRADSSPLHIRQLFQGQHEGVGAFATVAFPASANSRTANASFFASSLYGAEVDNGGHDQFYFNSSGMVWEDAQEGFTEIGITEAANIIAESAKRMGGRPSFDVKERRRLLEERQANFDDLDDRYYNLNVDVDARMLDSFARTPRISFLTVKLREG
jgi:hypothetical protein